MSNTEIIKMLSEIRDYLTAGNPVWDTDKVREAMNVAISDVMSVRQGRWIKSKAGGVLCSECYSYAPYVEKGSFTTKRIEQEKSAYCPNCGARMDGGDNE